LSKIDDGLNKSFGSANAEAFSLRMALREINQFTTKMSEYQMLSGHLQGKLLEMVSRMMLPGEFWRLMLLRAMAFLPRKGRLGASCIPSN
jgi:hypothetical protein